MDLRVFHPHVSREHDVTAGRESGSLVLLRIQSPSRTIFTVAAFPLPRFAENAFRPPFPYRAVGFAIIVSGLVCFAMARYLARPLQLVRDASYRLAAGDLQARAGPIVGRRRDEIGDLVRDFDAMAARVEALVQAHTQLLSDISHELRSPLARLNVALELARRKAGADTTTDLDRIELEAARMNELIGRVLALARAETHQSSPTEIVDLADVVQRVADDATYEAQRHRKAVALCLKASAHLPGDEQLLASAIDNVMRNAIRYTPDGSSVEVVLDCTDREAVITTRDHGPGVPLTEQERIFTPFHRIETARNAESGGVGLGLAIATRAVVVHGGTITADNAPAGGLVITIRLPLRSLPPRGSGAAVSVRA
jgi:two-component system sensor histidine kinase CpxA